MTREQARRDLKACPFCGEDYVVIVHDDHGSYWCHCDNCYASGVMKASLDAAVAAWNRRPESK